MKTASLYLFPALVLAAMGTLEAEVSVVKTGEGTVEVKIDGKPFTTLYAGPETMKPYLHPLRAASGTVVTRMYPMERQAGESEDHPHHRGLWFTHGDVNGYDFWANEPSQKGVNKGKGTVRLVKLGRVESGKHKGTIEATFAWVDGTGKTILTEQRTMEFSGDGKVRTIDFDATLTAETEVRFGDTKEGTFAIRLAAALEEPTAKSLAAPPRTGHMVSSTGKQGEKEIWGKRFSWVDYWGTIGSEMVGVAIFDHPGNPKYPTYWHSRSYGLFAANIFGEHDFYADKSKDGSLTLAPGKPLRFRYRVLIHPGNTEQANIRNAFSSWAPQH